MNYPIIHGSGLGLRSEFIEELINLESVNFKFLEFAPENWMQIQGWRKELLIAAFKKHPAIAHGLSLSIGSPESLNLSFMEDLKLFFDELGITHYSEHLSYCSDKQGFLYELLPLPFTEEAVLYISKRIKQVQDYLGMSIAFENSSYYYQLDKSLKEHEFINAIIEESGCKLLLDVNNAYVNGFNHGYDPIDFISKLPTDNIDYIHIAGHFEKSKDLIIDTHGSEVVSDVWDLLQATYKIHGIKPTLLERDSDIPPLATLLKEVEKINQLQTRGGDEK